MLAQAFSILLATLISFGAVGIDSQDAPEAEVLWGNWQFHRYILKGETHSIPNPQLVLQYEFFADGTNRLFWTRKNEPGFCERQALYLYQDELIHQEVVWVNPENSIECSKDMDMQLGQKNTTRLKRVGEFLHLHIPFSGEDFIYVLKRVR